MAQTQGLPAGKRPSRVALFLPYILLFTLVVLWSAGWLWIRSKAASEMDAWLARETAAGRSWNCADRSITGYPFRIELRCASLTFARADSRFSLGPLTVVVQVYQPRKGILEAKGPFHVEQGDLVADADWAGLEASFHGEAGGFSRASLVVDGPKVAIRGAAAETINGGAKRLEAHARPNPGRFASEGAVDVSVRLTEALSSALDAMIGNADPADLALDATVDQAALLRTGRVETELEAWRVAGGSLDIALLSLAKGERRVQASGKLDLDEAHRPSGQLDVRAAGLEALVGQVMGQRFGSEKGAMIGNLVGQLLGGGKRARAETDLSGESRLKSLPPLRLVDGRLLLGPFPIPNVRIPPLY